MVGVGEGGGRVQAGSEWLVIDCPPLFPVLYMLKEIFLF